MSYAPSEMDKRDIEHEYTVDQPQASSNYWLERADRKRIQDILDDLQQKLDHSDDRLYMDI